MYIASYITLLLLNYYIALWKSFQVKATELHEHNISYVKQLSLHDVKLVGDTDSAENNN